MTAQPAVSPLIVTLLPPHALRRILQTFRERLLSGFSWNVVSAVALQGSVLLTSVVLARLLGLEDFGIYAVLVGTVMMAAGIAQGGTGLIAAKFVGELLGSDAVRVGRVLRMCALMAGFTGAITSVLLFLLAPVVAGTLLGKPQIEPFVRWVAIATIFQVVSAYQIGALQGFSAFRRISRAGVIAGLLHFGISVAGALAAGLMGALLGFIVASAGRAAIFAAALRQERRDHGIARARRTPREDWRLVWTFALPATLASLVTLPCLWGVTVLVARQPDGLAWVALFSVGHQVRLTVLQLPTLLNAVSFSVLSRLKGQGDPAAFRQVFWSNLAVGLVFVTLVATGLSMVASEILSLYGPAFSDGRGLLIILLLSTVPELLASSTYQLIQSGGRMWHSLLLIAVPRDLTYLVLASGLLVSQALHGAGVAYLVAQMLGALLTIVLARTRAAAPDLAR